MSDWKKERVHVNELNLSKLNFGEVVVLLKQVLRLQEGVEVVGRAHLQRQCARRGDDERVLGAMLDDVVLHLLGCGRNLLEHSNTPLCSIGLIKGDVFYARRK